MIASYQSRGTIARCLAALVPQCRDAPAEVVVVDSGSDGAAALVAEQFPEVTLVRCEERLFPGGARNLGVARARGAVLGFIDADCVAGATWVARAIEAQDGDGVSVGGAITPAEPRGLLDWAAYFCSFHAWMPGTPAGPMADIPTCCLSIKRPAFERHGPFRETGYSSDTELNWRMARAGEGPRFDPGLEVAHIAHPTPLAFVQRLFARGRAFARMRVAERRLSRSRRALYAMLSPGLPCLLFVRLLRRAFAQPCPYRRPLIAAGPLVLLGFAFWSIGELSGYVRR